MFDINTHALSPAARERFENAWPTIAASLDDRASKTPDTVAYSYPDSHDTWQQVTWGEFRDWVHRVAAGLAAHGVMAGDRVAIIANTSIHWLVADFAIAALGAVTTTIYPNAHLDDYRHILAHSAATLAIVDNGAIAAKVRECSDAATTVRGVVTIADSDRDDVVAWSDLEKVGDAFAVEYPTHVRDAMAAVTRDSVATIIYTSGTTGAPKGVVITHGAWIYLSTALSLWPIIGPDDVHYLWLPMSHAFGKGLVLVGVFHGTEFAVDGRTDRIVDNLAIIRPTIMCGVPRIFEKVRAAAMTQSSRGSAKAKIARWAFGVGRRAYPYRIEGRAMPPRLAAEYALADTLVFSKLRAKFGGRLRFCISGSAKLSPQVQEWFYSAGIPVYEGYGVTEGCAIMFFNHPPIPMFGTVGPVIPGAYTKIAGDGEVLFKAPCVMQGYLDDPELTAQTIDPEGWLHTGDIGHFDSSGNLVITDRKKDLIKTSGGKYIAPSEVEATLLANCPYVSQAVVVGEGQKYAAALLVLDPDSLARWAAKRKIVGTYAELTQLPQIKASIQKYVDRANSRLGKWETVKKFAILEHELTIEDGTVTANMKVRRRKVVEQHAELVASLFAESGETLTL